MLCSVSFHVAYFIPDNLYLLIPSPLPSKPQATTMCFLYLVSVSVLLDSQDCYIYFRFHIKVMWFTICLSLTYFIMHNTLKVHPCCCRWQNFIFFGCILFCCIYVQHLLYSSVNGHLGCFNDLAIVNNAGVNIRVCMSIWFSVFHFFAYILNSAIIFDKDNDHSEQLNNCK